jgi:NADPH:quinone reductase-like Zn-dependent oxidoreductase
MKQIRFHSFGQPSAVVKVVDLPDVGAPSPWEVVVDVEAFPINPADLAMLAGRYGKLPKLPATIGMEAVGRIAARGASVTELEVGDRVVILANDNWAYRRKVPVATVHKVSAEGEVAQYAMLKVNPATAYMLLTRFAKLAANDWVAQTAPLSSVGRAVIQIAKTLKLRTLNIVRRPEAKAEVLALGGDLAIEDAPELAARVRAEIGAQPVRLALDAVGGSGVARLAECLADGGQIVNYGMLSGESCAVSSEQLIFRGITLSGFWLSSVLNRLSLTERKSLYSTIGDMIEAGNLRMAVDAQFSFHEIHEAIRRAEQGGRNGKILVSIAR